MTGGIKAYAGQSFGQFNDVRERADSPNTLKHFRSASPNKRNKVKKSSYARKNNFAVAALNVERHKIQPKGRSMGRTLSDHGSP